MSEMTARPGQKDGHAYAVWSSPMPVLHAYMLDDDVSALSVQLARHGAITLVDPFRLVVLKQLLRSTAPLVGEVWELGVYQGGTAAFMRNLLLRYFGPDTPVFRMFDTFAGMPPGNPELDWHVEGDFQDASLPAVRALVGADPFLDFRPGFVPDTFAGLDGATLRFAHVDLDLHSSILASITFAYPRLAPGGVLLFDDYGFVSCPGARQAVDEFFAVSGDPVIVLPTGQAFVIKR